MSSDGYLKHAATAEAWARKAASDAERQAYLEIASLWRDLATRQAEAAAMGAPCASDDGAATGQP